MNRLLFRSLAPIIACAACTAWAAASTPVTCRVELDRGVLPADGPQKAVIKVSLNAAKPPPRERPAVNLALVLDHSGSMSGEKLHKAKDAAIEALRRLGSQDVASVVIYNHEVETLVPAQSAKNLEDIERRIRSIHADGNTALYSGVSQAAAEIRKNLDRRCVNRILLLSDGQANVGPSSPDDLARLGVSLRKEQVGVTTVGVGTDYNEDLMTRLARESDGNTYFVESSADLSRIFAAEIGDVLNVVAKDVVITIEFPAGVRPLRIIGRDGRMQNDRVEINLSQLYGGQEKFALVEIEIPAGSDGHARSVATATVRYENAATQKSGEASETASVRFSRRAEDVDRSSNLGVQRDIVVNVSAAANNEAISLNDQGRQKEAATMLRGKASSLRGAADKYKAPELKARAIKLEAAASEMESGAAMPSATRKAMRADEYQTISQQATQ